ncbi:MAG TPA: hypothetical protein VFO09_02195 [Methyloceanibacter sp.]|jgi:hypothetical protein|nr:hypothetical protein [Methyloceanibacter sp.]
MNRRNTVIALGALVAGVAALVYVHNEMGDSPRPKATGTALAASAQQGQASEPLYDFHSLPGPVKATLERIAAAAETGEIENMRVVLESNELRPMVTDGYVEDQIAFWKKQSADGSGRDVLAAMLDVMSSGFVRMGQGQDEIYVWPYFAEADLSKLTPAQEVELYRLVSPELAVPMKKDGKYRYYRLGISPSGVWHYFLQ